MLVQENLGNAAVTCCPSQTEGSVTCDEATEGKSDDPDESGQQPAFGAKDVRQQLPGDRAKRVALLKKSLSTLKIDGSGKTEARRKSIMYSLSILEK